MPLVRKPVAGSTVHVQRTGTTASAATITPDVNTQDNYTVTALAVAAQFANPTGTPVNGQRLMIRVKDNATARALTWGTNYRGLAAALPATTVVSKTTYIGFIYNSTDSLWDLVTVVTQV